jgi:hypothetical protein
MRRRFRVGCGCFFLGGRGRGRGVPGRVLLRSFRRTAGSEQPLFCVIYYMLSSGGFAAACLQAIVKGVSSILGRPGQTRAMFQASTTRRPVHTLDDSGGAAAPRSTRTPRSSGYDFLCTCGLCCYMLYVYYMLYACYMSSSEPSSGSSGSVWIYRRAIFGKQNWLCARMPCTMYRRVISGKQNWPCARTPCTQ